VAPVAGAAVAEAVKAAAVVAADSAVLGAVAVLAEAVSEVAVMSSPEAAEATSHWATGYEPRAV
jgi:hypothetical protein